MNLELMSLALLAVASNKNSFLILDTYQRHVGH